jgi:ribosomal protein S12 methylthiotransferase accessory factor YcaO
LDAIQVELWQPVPEEYTHEQRAEFAKAEAAKRAEALKKNKKKPKTEDEEAADMKEIVSRVVSSLTTQYTDVEVEKCELAIEI